MSLPKMTDSSRDTPLDTFTVFPNLPSELQLKIWDWAVIGTPYQTPHVHHITQRFASKQQMERYWPIRFTYAGLWTDPHLPLGYRRLAEPPEYFPTGEIPIQKSSRPIDPLLHTCSYARNKILTEFDMLFAFGTYVNMDHDFLFLEMEPKPSTLRSIINHLPSEFPGVAVWEDMIAATEEMEPSAIYDNVSPITLVHQSYGSQAESVDLVFVEYEKFWGKPVVYQWGDPSVKQHVVAVPRAKIEGLKGLKNVKKEEPIFEQLRRSEGVNVKEDEEEKLVEDFMRML